LKPGNSISTIRTVLFDLDGTLLDTAPDIAYAINTLREEESLPPLPYEEIRPIVSHGSSTMIRYAFGLSEENPKFELLRQRFLGIYVENLANETDLFPGMEDVINTIEKRGNMNWGVVTNKPAWLTDPLMEEMRLTGRAACIVSGDTTDNSKPHPEPMLHACKLAGSEADECLYIGDAPRDIKAGRNAGMKTLVAMFGYISKTDVPENWGADALIDQPADILKWLDN